MDPSLASLPNPAPATPAWVKTILKELQGINPASLGPLAPWADVPADAPPWLQRVEQELAKSFFPGLAIEEPQTLSPAHLGTLLGQQCANFASLTDVMAKFQDGLPATAVKLDRATVRACVKGVGTTRKMIRRALALALKQPHPEAAAFFQAFARAFARPPRGHGSNLGTPAFPVYLWLYVLHPLLPQLHSVAQLHQVLRHILGPALAGDRKRLEKICQRIGLRLRPPGRPAKKARAAPSSAPSRRRVLQSTP